MEYPTQVVGIKLSDEQKQPYFIRKCIDENGSLSHVSEDSKEQINDMKDNTIYDRYLKTGLHWYAYLIDEDIYAYTYEYIIGLPLIYSSDEKFTIRELNEHTNNIYQTVCKLFEIEKHDILKEKDIYVHNLPIAKKSISDLIFVSANV